MASFENMTHKEQAEYLAERLSEKQWPILDRHLLGPPNHVSLLPYQVPSYGEVFIPYGPYDIRYGSIYRCLTWKGHPVKICRVRPVHPNASKESHATIAYKLLSELEFYSWESIGHLECVRSSLYKNTYYSDPIRRLRFMAKDGLVRELKVEKLHPNWDSEQYTALTWNGHVLKAKVGEIPFAISTVWSDSSDVTTTFVGVKTGRWFGTGTTE